MKKFNILIAGGGSTYTPGIVAMLADHNDQFPIGEIKLYDDLAERQEPIGEACKIMLQEKIQTLNFHIQLIPKKHLLTLIFVWPIFV